MSLFYYVKIHSATSSGLPAPTTMSLPSSSPTSIWLLSLVTDTLRIGSFSAKGLAACPKLQHTPTQIHKTFSIMHGKMVLKCFLVLLLTYFMYNGDQKTEKKSGLFPLFKTGKKSKGFRILRILKQSLGNVPHLWLFSNYDAAQFLTITI